MATKPQLDHGFSERGEGQEIAVQEKLDKMPFKKAFKSECSAEFADTDYPFSWRGKKFNCLHKGSKKKDEDRYESGKPPSGYKP